MINTKYFDTLDTPEKVYILSLILLNLKEKYNNISLKSEFTIHHIDKGENKSATYMTILHSLFRPFYFRLVYELSFLEKKIVFFLVSPPPQWRSYSRAFGANAPAKN